jgi:tetratricopeptide (TPR) repeat protein
MHISRKVRISGILLIGLLLISGGCTSSLKPRLSANAQAEALSHFSRGLRAAPGGDSVAAFDQLQAALRLDPDEEKLYAPAVALALEIQQPDEAVRLAREGVQRHPDAAAPTLLLARVYALTGKPDQAETLARNILKAFPENPEAPAFLTRLCLSQNRNAEAIDILRISVRSQPDPSELLYLLGTLCIESARTPTNAPNAQAAIEEGIGFLQQALDRIPDDPAIWQQLGVANQAINRPDDALTAFKEARRYAPEDIPLARQYCDLLIQTGNYDEAIASGEALAADTGTDPELWIEYLVAALPPNERPRLARYLDEQILKQPQAAVFYSVQLGSLYIGESEFKKAETVLTEALNRYPENTRLRSVLGHLNLLQERYSDAYTELERVRTEAPETEWSSNPFFLSNLLIAAQKSDHLQEAARILSATYTSTPAALSQYIRSVLTGTSPVSPDQAIELLNLFRTQSPNPPEALYYLMVLQAEQKEYAQAIATAQQFEDHAQNSGATNLLTGEFYYQYAALYERTDRLDAAEKLFYKAIDLGEEPLAAAAQNYIAYMWAERGEKLDSGLKLIQKALATDPENGAYLDTLGWIYYMQGRYTDALRELQKAQGSVQNDPAVWEHLGDTWQKLGNRDEASKHWKKALEFDPESPSLIDRLNTIPTAE